MCRFYGWTHVQLMDLDVDLFDEYWQAIDIIEAKEQLVRLSAADWPNLKPSYRETQHRQLHERAYPASFNEAKPVSNADLARILSGG